MNIRCMSLTSVFLSAVAISCFAMESGEKGALGKRTERTEASNTEDNRTLREIQAARHAAHRANVEQQRAEQERKDAEEKDRQEELNRQAQAEQLEQLTQAQDLFEALEALINTLNILIDALETVPDFDTLCQQIDGIAEVIGTSNLDFAFLQQSGNDILVQEINNLHNSLVTMVTKIQANLITNKACFKLETINDQLALICQLVGFNGDIKVEVQDMYTEEDDAIAQGEYQQEQQVYTQGDENLAAILAAADREELDAVDEALARELQAGANQENILDDETYARQLQQQLEEFDNFDGRF